MLNSGTFSQYTTCARTLQRMINFERHSLSDFQLAEGMAFGLLTELENEVNKLDLLKRKEFKFKEFIRQVGNCYDALPRKTYHPRAGASNTSSQQNPTTGNVPRNEYIWRIHSYLDSVGKCHHCKQYCSNAAGTCPGPAYCGPVNIPPTFVVPPKPANYVEPRAWTKPHGAGTQAGPAQPGRPTGRPAGVAAVTDDAAVLQEEPAEVYNNTDFEEYHAAAIETLDEIESLLADETNTSTPTPDDGLAACVATTEILNAEHRLFIEGEASILEHPGFNSLLLNRVEGEFSKDDSEEISSNS
ncbi:hypothetical protein PTTG_02267 [Puccinia triticina 1-1 BBBD Race 1]|uniref:Uncharacterized protein n=1 Tax=Puccinia triticina (isolate 1-1 / race 1 (BBBD)) TaxID=630390 RepID=A0A180G5X2_PUCT1|nr:hypothetical protein PTTG_02267 [Puccinia triticina 1-1 BBBD Race 1]